MLFVATRKVVKPMGKTRFFGGSLCLPPVELSCTRGEKLYFGLGCIFGGKGNVRKLVGILETWDIWQVFMSSLQSVKCQKI